MVCIFVEILDAGLKLKPRTGQNWILDCTRDFLFGWLAQEVCQPSNMPDVFVVTELSHSWQALAVLAC